MPKKHRGGRRAYARGGVLVSGTSQPAGQATIVASNTTPTKAVNMTDKDAKDLRTQYDSSYDPDVVASIKMYISDSNPNGDGYSHSQNMNYKLDNGMKLNPTEKFIDDNIQSGMHDIGRKTQLTRFCHDDILKQCGVKNYQNMSEAQLKSQLVGLEFKTTSYSSYSYDVSKNPFRVGVSGGNGREVTMITDTKKDTKMVFGAKNQAEIVLNKGTKQRITDVYFDGTTAKPRGKGAMPRIVIKTEAID